jgi:hypothetical protein
MQVVRAACPVRLQLSLGKPPPRISCPCRRRCSCFAPFDFSMLLALVADLALCSLFPPSPRSPLQVCRLQLPEPHHDPVR